MVRLRLTASGEEALVETELDKQFAVLKELVKDFGDRCRPADA